MVKQRVTITRKEDLVEDIEEVKVMRLTMTIMVKAIRVKVLLGLDTGLLRQTVMVVELEPDRRRPGTLVQEAVAETEPAVLRVAQVEEEKVDIHQVMPH